MLELLDFKPTSRCLTANSLALTITCIPYTTVEIPASLDFKCVGANILLPTMAMLWGLTTTLQGSVNSYQGLLAAQFFFRLFEGGLLPGIMLEPVLQAGSIPNAHVTSIHRSFIGWRILWPARIQHSRDGRMCRTQRLAVDLHSGV